MGEWLRLNRLKSRLALAAPKGGKKARSHQDEERRLQELIQEMSDPPSAADLRQLMSATYRSGRYSDCKAVLEMYRARGLPLTPFVQRTADLLDKQTFVDFSPIFSIRNVGAVPVPKDWSTTLQRRLEEPWAEWADAKLGRVWSEGLSEDRLNGAVLLSSRSSPDSRELTFDLPGEGEHLLLIEARFAEDQALEHPQFCVSDQGGSQSLVLPGISAGSSRMFAVAKAGADALSLRVTLCVDGNAQIAWEHTAEVVVAQIPLAEIGQARAEAAPEDARWAGFDPDLSTREALERLAARFLSRRFLVTAAAECIARRERAGSLGGGVLDWLRDRDGNGHFAYDVASALYYQHKQIRAASAIARDLMQIPFIAKDPARRERLDRFVGSRLLLGMSPLLDDRRPSALTSSPGKVMMFLHQTLPFDTNGYAVRSHYLASAVDAHWDVLCVGRVGYPKDIAGQRRQNHDGLSYVLIDGADLNQVSEWRYIHSAAGAVARLVAAERPQVLHAASGYANAWPVLMAARRFGLPFIYEVRGFWEMSMAASRPELLDSDRAELIRRHDTELAQHADQVLVLTRAMGDELVRRGVNPDKIQVAPNAVDPALIQPQAPDAELAARLGLAPGRMTVGYAGSLAAYEGLDLLLAALGGLRREGVPFNLLVVGDGADRERLEALALSEGLTENVAFTGRVPHEDVAAYCALMDICPFPRLPQPVSEHVSPLKPFEAMARSKAIVVSSVAAMTEFVEPGVNGEVFDKGDAASLATVLRRLIGSPDETAQLGARGREWVASQRTWADSARVVVEAYRRALEVGDGPAEGAPGPAVTNLPFGGLQKTVTIEKPTWITVEGRIAPMGGDPETPSGLRIRLCNATGRPLCLESDDAMARGLVVEGPGKEVRALASASRETNRVRSRFRIDESGDWTIVVESLNDHPLYVLGDIEVRADPERPPAVVRDELTIALIADTFTSRAFGDVASCTPVSRTGFAEQLASTNFDLFLCESAWEGAGGEWRRGVGWYSDEEFADLKAVIEAFRARGVPTVFFNKEDPVHFSRFARTAAHFDHVVTTDAAMVPRYLGLPDSRILTAEGRPFFANAAIHHPFGEGERAGDFCYAGTYYGARYPERTRQLNPLLSEAARQGLVIYDRQSLLADSPYPLPEALRPYAAEGLSYDEMLVAYRRHGVFLNVNSVEDSPTMFSRRVVEALASGAAVISGPGLAVRTQFHGQVPIADGPAQAREIMQTVAADPLYRQSLAAVGGRVVRSRFMASQWLKAIASSAGVDFVGAFRLPSYAARLDIGDADEVTVEAALDGLLHQSMRPLSIQLDLEPEAATARFGVALAKWRRWASEAGVDLRLASAKSPAADADYEVRIDPRAWYGAHCFEDLLALTAHIPADRIGKAMAEDSPQGARDGLQRRPAFVRNARLDPSCLLRRRGSSPRARTGVAGNALSYHPTPRRQGPQRLLIAGHDLKFIEPFYTHFEAAGYEVLVDKWSGHNQADAKVSRRLLAQADVVFCEWMLGNACWYAENAQPHQTLVGRFHRQELQTRYAERLDVERFHRIFYVGTPTREAALERFGWADGARHVVVGNGVDVAVLDIEKPAEARFTLGFVGMTPSLKRVDRALDILAAARVHDPRFRLRIKGRKPSELPWVMKQPKEKEFFEKFWTRLKTDPLIAGAVDLDPHGPDMAEWYAKVGFVLSTSTLESFHFSVADGAASRAVPVVLPWHGVEDIYGGDWLSQDAVSAADRIVSLAEDPAAWRRVGAAAREVIVDRYGMEHVAERMIRHIRMDDFERTPVWRLPGGE